VLEQIRGEPWDQAVASAVLRRAGATGVKSAGAGGRALRAVVGYGEDGHPEPWLNLATYASAGALAGRAIDLLAFDQALMRGRLLDSASRAAMWRGEPSLGYAALGAWAFPASLPRCGAEVAIVERRGAIGGVQVRNVLAPTLGRAVIVFTNRASVDFGEVWLGRGLLFELLEAAFCP
jgi:D-alanyl-D-alanine carboxypeptidase